MTGFAAAVLAASPRPAAVLLDQHLPSKASPSPRLHHLTSGQSRRKASPLFSASTISPGATLTHSSRTATQTSRQNLQSQARAAPQKQPL